MVRQPACGIDFGTSNSSVAVLGERSGANRPRLIELQEGATAIPTALFFSFDDDTTTYGREAGHKKKNRIAKARAGSPETVRRRRRSGCRRTKIVR